MAQANLRSLALLCSLSDGFYALSGSPGFGPRLDRKKQMLDLDRSFELGLYEDCRWSMLGL